ncbi:MAG: hypothetical protein AAB581_00290 [Patescibacteria group bacterium]
MPDISLLQREYEVMEDVSRVPGVALTVCLSIFIVAAGAYAGLYFYNGILAEQLAAQQREMEELRTNDAAKTLEGLRTFSNKARVLASLRENHRYPSKMFARVERTTHPAAHFTSALADAKTTTMKLTGSIESAVMLARQVDIWVRDTESVSGFALKSIRYGENHAVEFDLELTVKP